ncbi:MAG: LytTR family DNA-binding domain-containing protein [Bacteroidota bacterium]|nr:LytTR family DNA-binding domain-containing protein [Bacteroidota bacterium]
MIIRCLIVDDEPLAQRVIEHYIEDIPFLTLVGKCNNAIEALDFFYKQPVDLVFLDINMPKLGGLDFLRSLKNPPKVIITSAYAEYAIQGFELDVIDFLMKPFGLERFLKAIHKAQELMRSQEIKAEPMHSDLKDETYIFVKSNKKTFRINLSDILYVEALGDYVKIFTIDKMIISYQSLKNIERLLPSKTFPRIHKSYIVSLAHIDLIEGNQVKIRNHFLPIGTNFKADFEKLIRLI